MPKTSFRKNSDSPNADDMVIQDKRIKKHAKTRKLHALTDIMVLSICATVSGAEGWQGIVDFGHEKLDWLRRFVPLKNGMPSHDCIAYVLA